MKAKLSVLLILLLLSGCVTVFPQGVGLLPASKSNVVFDRNVWLRLVEIKGINDNNDTISHAETAMTLSIKKYIEEKQLFSSVRVLPGKIGEGDHQLAFFIDNYMIKRCVHPAYFPAALMTLTIYLWVNGPIYIDKVDIAGRLIVYDTNEQELAVFSESIKFEKNVGFYDPEYYAMSGIESRTQLIEKLIGKYMDLLNKQ